MNRRTFLRFGAGVFGAAVTAKIAHAAPELPVNSALTVCGAEQPMLTVIRMVKKQTRAARKSGLYPTRQARYAADSRIYSLAWRVNARLIALADRPALMFATQDEAYVVAIKWNLYVNGNCVIAREFDYQG